MILAALYRIFSFASKWAKNIFRTKLIFRLFSSRQYFQATNIDIDSVITKDTLMVKYRATEIRD